MPITIPTIDDRRYQQIVDEAIARIPVYTPEYTNFNRSDPGVTLIEAFAFIAESLLYRSNQIPERNRLKFLSLLGVPLQPASSARGLVTFTAAANATPQTVTLPHNVEVGAGNVPFRTELGLDLLPIEAPVYYKRIIDLEGDPQAQEKLDYYRQAYATYIGDNSARLPDNFRLYDTTRLEVHGDNGSVDLSQTTDQSLWFALLAQKADQVNAARAAIGGKTVSIGFVPIVDNASRSLLPGKRLESSASALFDIALPLVGADGRLPANRQPTYRTLESSVLGDVLHEPGIIQVVLPEADQLRLWTDIEPQEEGVNGMPPMLDDDDRSRRLITWLRVRLATGAQTRLLWTGINAAMVTQRALVANELLATGNGEPNQRMTLARAPVLPGTVRLTLTTKEGNSEDWTEIDDLLGAGSEVPERDLRRPPGTAQPRPRPSTVFALDAESGMLHFGDGFRGKRPPFDSTLRASYAHSAGRAGNVGAGAISTVSALADGIKVTNPVRTWGGAEAESVSDGEKQVARYLQHRDRLVTEADFSAIVRRTPGVEIGRLEVLTAYHPTWSQEPGDAAGAVTLLLLPMHDPLHPNAPQPDPIFLNSVCAYLEPRRLVTTELHLRGPEYQQLWISVGIKVVAHFSFAEAREAVRLALNDFLSPYRWPLRKSVIDRELMAVVSRVPAVQFVNNLLLARGEEAAATQINFTQLQLPRIMAISVTLGDAAAIDEVRAQQPSTTGIDDTFLAVPIVPEECR
jgi:hypothetical protein